MRKWNARISMGLVVLFLFHMILGGFQLVGWLPGGNRFLKVIAWCLVALMAAHIVIGFLLTLRTVRSIRCSRVSYPRENRLFWARRISGFAVFFFMIAHLLLFTQRGEGAARLAYFGVLQLLSQILLVLTLAVHIISNVRPAMIALGIGRWKEYAGDILFVLSILLLLGGASFVIYFLRWQSL